MQVVQNLLEFNQLCHPLFMPPTLSNLAVLGDPATMLAMPTQKSLSDWRRLGGAATTIPRPQRPVCSSTHGSWGSIVGAIRTRNPVQGVSALLLR